MRLTQLVENSLSFPSPEHALRQPNGLLAMGGDLSSSRLLCAYRNGIFPWYEPGNSILWWSPDPRAVLLPEKLHISRSLNRFLRQTRYRYSINRDFEQVVSGCAEDRNDGTWIGSQILQGYLLLHKQGHAHSIEVWDGTELAGGLYGVAVGRLFCGESMFSRRLNASKCAIKAFCHYFIDQGGELIDCQVLNPHTASLGAREIPRRHFLQLLSRLSQLSLPLKCWLPQDLPSHIAD